MQEYLYLTPTDTTIGFVSKDSSKIDIAKKRADNKRYIRAVKDLKTLKSFTRVPNRYKNFIRRSTKKTFIMPNGRSFRVVKGSKHNLLLDRLDYAFSSSANLSGEGYNREYAFSKAEVIIGEPNSKNLNPSKIYKLGVESIKSIR